MAAGIPTLPPPVFVNDADGLDPNLILADMIAAFEAAAGRTLQPAQVERLLINLYAYRESLVRNAIQYAGQQNLLAFANFPMLDYLGALVGVTRLSSQGATTTLQFTLINPLTVALTIPAGTFAGTNDGQFAFATNTPLVIAPGQTTGSVGATATTAGAAANGYLPGQVNVQLNPNAAIASVTNTVVTGGGATPESDDHLRARIQAAPSQFSVAGSGGGVSFLRAQRRPVGRGCADSQSAAGNGECVFAHRADHSAARGIAEQRRRRGIDSAAGGRRGAERGHGAAAD